MTKPSTSRSTASASAPALKTTSRVLRFIVSPLRQRSDCPARSEVPSPARGSTDGDLGEHPGLEVPGEVAHEEVLAGRRQVDGAILRCARVDVVPVAHLGDAGALLDDVACGVDWVRGGGQIAPEHQQLMGNGATVGNDDRVLTGRERRGTQSDLELAEI